MNNAIDHQTTRQRALIEAVLHPPIFRQMYDAGLAGSDESTCVTYLLERRFSPRGARTCAQTFRETMQFLRLELGV